MTSLRLVFAGSPAAAVPSLRALLVSGHEVAAVVTREDSLQGRRRVLTPTPVADVAVDADVAVVKANRLAPVTDELIGYGADLGVVVAYGGLIREPLLSAPRFGWINLHFSLLPRWRGAAPVQRAVMAGDTVTGASVFQLTPGLDEGDVFATLAQPIGAHTTSGQLLETLADSGAELLVSVVDSIADGTAVATPQQGEVTLAPKLSVVDGAIDWNSSGAELAARIRGVTPEPGASTHLDGARLKVLAAAVAHGFSALEPGLVEFRDGRVLVGTGDIPLELLEVQPSGKRPMPAADWFRGRPQGHPTVLVNQVLS